MLNLPKPQPHRELAEPLSLSYFSCTSKASITPRRALSTNNPWMLPPFSSQKRKDEDFKLSIRPTSNIWLCNSIHSTIKLLVRTTAKTLSSSGVIAIFTPGATCKRGLSMEGCREDDSASVFCETVLAGRPLFQLTRGALVLEGIASTRTIELPLPIASKLPIFLLAA